MRCSVLFVPLGRVTMGVVWRWIRYLVEALRCLWAVRALVLRLRMVVIGVVCIVLRGRCAVLFVLRCLSVRRFVRGSLLWMVCERLRLLVLILGVMSLVERGLLGRPCVLLSR